MCEWYSNGRNYFIFLDHCPILEPWLMREISLVHLSIVNLGREDLQVSFHVMAVWVPGMLICDLR